jgi:hypothetical protein
MIKRVLIILAVFMAVSLIGLWFVTGGVGKIKRVASSMGSPIDFFTSEGGGIFSIRLPWQPEELSLGADLSQYAEGEEQYDPQDLGAMQSRTDEIQREINEAKTFGDPSPYKGKVTLSNRESSPEGTPAEEYIVVRASSANTAPVSLSGWSLQSILTAKRVQLPPASSLFVLGVVNPVTHISLAPGQVAIVNTGASPVGVSFRENTCSGYLAQFQSFYPDIERSCPDPSHALPQIPENLQRYGAACTEFVNNLQSCTYPRNNLPATLSPACKAFVTNTYTYNGCVTLYQSRVDFKKDTWRLFLGVIEPLWNNSHDIIRLLDADGRTVDVLTY